MKSQLRILHLENDVADSDLLRARLALDNVNVELDRVETREQFLRALERGGYDVIIADYSLPAFDGGSALALAREHRPTVTV